MQPYSNRFANGKDKPLSIVVHTNPDVAGTISYARNLGKRASTSKEKRLTVSKSARPTTVNSSVIMNDEVVITEEEGEGGTKSK